MSPRLRSRPRRRPRVAVAALLAVVLGSGACAAADPVVAPSPSSPPPSLDARAAGPLTSFPACNRVPEPGPDPAPDALFLPPGAIVTAVSETGALVNVQGYIPQTPVQILFAYDQVESYSTVQSEHEVREAELLVADGEHRIFVKAQAICDQGSIFVAVIAPEAAADAVPTPAGTGAPADG